MTWILVKVDIDPAGSVATAVMDYVHAVARGVGVCTDGNADTVEVEFDLLTSAYVALPFRAPNFPAYDLALVWDEESGWAVAIESDPNYPPIAIVYQGGQVLPAPAAVVAFVDDLRAGRQPGQPNRPVFRRGSDDDDLRARLTDYRRCP
ncbi:DUF6292 family protein [Saccharopolyspora hattusasensis]|uniref:DUF6292 family protein n=1 Tax=Saccharopolyspora hattusasensis TaxID=1128679 RepID=UPI003D979C87